MVLGFIFQSNGHNFLNGTGIGKFAHSFVAKLKPKSPWGGRAAWRREGGTSWRQELSLVTCCLGLRGHRLLTFYRRTGLGDSLGISPGSGGSCISPLHNPD